MRYALFYGLYFNQCDVRLSYVKQYGVTIAEPYSLLSILGFKPKSGLVDPMQPTMNISFKVEQIKTNYVSDDEFHMMDMMLCPYRYFLDYVVNGKPIYRGHFLFQKYFENMLIEGVWKRINGMQPAAAKQRLAQYVDEECDKLAPYFPFWKKADFIDLKLRAINYLQNAVVTSRKSMPISYDDKHMRIRKQFGAAKFVIDAAQEKHINPYPAYENLATRNRGKNTKEYSLHRIASECKKSANTAQKLRNDLKAYINESDCLEQTTIPSDWCTYCAHRGSCVASFLNEEQ